MDILSGIIIIVVVVIFVFIFWRTNRKIDIKTKTDIDQLGTVIALLQSIDFNLKNITTRTNDYRSKKQFRVYAWKSYKEKLEFIDPGIVDKLREGFTTAEECNTKIESAFKNKDLALLRMLDMEKMREPLNVARTGLIEWLKIDYEKRHPAKGSQGLSKS
jgi:hypothetical protein